MKKGCIIVLVILLVLLSGVGVVAGVAVYKANQKIGLTEAPAVSHETLAGPETRLRALLRPEKLNAIIAAKVPVEKLELPSGAPQNLEQLLPWVMPREIALLSDTDYRKEKIGIVLFVNERRGGPFLVEQLNSSGLMKKLDTLGVALEWAPAVLEERGRMQAHFSLDIPKGLDARVEQDFPDRLTSDPVRIEGDHLLEVALENRDGELVALVGTIADAMGDDWERFFTETYVNMALSILPLVHSVRLTADLADFDTLKIQLRISAQSNAGPNLVFMIEMGRPFLNNALEEKKLKLEGETKWSPEEEELIGNYTLTGFEPLIDAYIAENF